MSEQQPEERWAEQLRRYAAPQEATYELEQRVVAEVARRKRRRAVVGSVAAAAVVIAGSVGVAQLLPERDAAPPAADRSGPPTARANIPVGGDWRAMAPSPLSPRHATLGVWTGSELVVVGGLTDFICPPTADCLSQGEPSAEAAAYDPATDSWRTLPDAPRPVANAGWPDGTSGDGLGTFEDVIAWTGEEVVVAHGGQLFSLDPGEGGWETRTIVTETSDLPPASGAAPAIVHASYDSGPRDDLIDWVLDPVTGTRTWFPKDPFGESYDRSIAWDGERFWLLSMDVARHFGAHAPSPSRLAVLEGNEWRVVEEESPGVVYGQKLSWDGERLVIAPQGDDDGHWFDPETETWGTLPAAGSEAPCPLPAAGAGPVWTAATGGVLVAGDQVVGVPACDDVFVQTSIAVWADDELLVWGGAGPGAKLDWRITDAGLRWRPPAP